MRNAWGNDIGGVSGHELILRTQDPGTVMATGHTLDRRGGRRDVRRPMWTVTAAGTVVLAALRGLRCGRRRPQLAACCTRCGHCGSRGALRASQPYPLSDHM